MTVRQMVEEIQKEIRTTPDLLPDRAAELLNKLSALTGNIADEIRQADVSYNRVLLEFLSHEEKANRAKIHSEVTPEYERKRIARDTYKLADELIKSLKYYLRVKEEEYRKMV